MKKLLSYRVLVITLLLGFVGLAVYVALPDDEIDFNADVKPIVNKHCISCHGGVKQSGGFSLLFEEEAKGNTTSGAPAIIPGHPDKSEMILRLLSNDPEERMPYEKDPLSHDEIQILKTWIQQGAKWDTHWTYIPVEKVEVPSEMVSEPQFTE